MDGLRKKSEQQSSEQQKDVELPSSHASTTPLEAPEQHTDNHDSHHAPRSYAKSYAQSRSESHSKNYSKSHSFNADNSENSHIENHSSHAKKSTLLKKYLQFLKKIALLLLSIMLLGVISYGGFLLYKTNSVSQSMRIDLGDDHHAAKETGIFSSLIPALNQNHAPLRGADDGRINVLLLGRAGTGYPGANLTDTIMIASFNTQTHKIGLLSLPRDLYVPAADKNYFTKINALYQRGLDNGVGAQLIAETVSDIIDQEIHYYVIADFDGFTEFVDTLGGVNVDVERDILDRRYPGPNYSYETFQLTRGLQVLDGATALKYARMRHDDPEGDFGRAKRQQKTLQAIRNNVFSARTLLNPIKVNTLLDTLGDHVRTDITPAEIESFIALSKSLDTQNINTVVADAWKRDSLLRVSHVYLRGIRAFILVPRVGDFSEIQELADDIFSLQKTQQRKERIATEQARILIVNESGNALLTTRIKELLGDLGFDKKNIRTKTNALEQKRTHTSIITHHDDRKIFSLDEIVRKIPSLVLTDENVILQWREDDDYDFTILLGTDIIERHTYDQYSIEEFNAQDVFTDTDLFTR